ncbi:MAG: aminoacetone oxidase family FAD-binding enzyme, partial [Verrucomicrobia bacterium]|nr:aminoacetone oxidase family FAD-binding enzyme [Verrucomicrobiota bacterium]
MSCPGNFASGNLAEAGRVANFANVRAQSLNGHSTIIVGAGPAGLRAAEVLAQRGQKVKIFEQKASPGRKFLIAGRGGLNITHSEDLESFATRYDAPERWSVLLKKFSPSDMRALFESLGVETFVGTSGRVFPRSVRAPMILERWLERLDRLGCDIQVGRRFHQLLSRGPFDVIFQHGKEFELVTAEAVVFALGGASWPHTGSDALWVEEFRRLGIRVNDFIPANVGWERKWSECFLKAAEGKPLKNLVVCCANTKVKGELLVTTYGLEGGAIYQLGRILRENPEIVIDFKPELSESELIARWRPDVELSQGLLKIWRLTSAAMAIIKEVAAPAGVHDWAKAVKCCTVK